MYGFSVETKCSLCQPEGSFEHKPFPGDWSAFVEQIGSMYILLWGHQILMH